MAAAVVATTSLPDLPHYGQSPCLDSGGFDSSVILILRGGILMSTGSFLESLSQAINISRDNLSSDVRSCLTLQDMTCCNVICRMPRYALP